jgi:hypothetical protein
MTRITILLPLLPLAACDWIDGRNNAPAGFASACLSGPRPEDLYEQGGALFEIEGTVLSDEAGTPPASDMECYGERDRLLSIEEADGTVRVLSYGIADPDGGLETPALDVTVGQQVSLLYRVVAEFGSAQGFVLSDADGLVAALESGTWGPALQDGDVPGLSVRDGNLMYTLEEECGTAGHFEWVFAGDEEVVVEPYGPGSVSIGGALFEAWAIANMQWQGDVQCTDLANDQMWAVFR